MSNLSQFFGSIPAGSKIPAPWAMADGTVYMPCDGRKVSSSQVSASVYAGLGFSITKTANLNTAIAVSTFTTVTKGGSTILSIAENNTPVKHTTDGATWSTGTGSNNTRYGLGYDATNALFISCNGGASGNCLETINAVGDGTVRSNGGASGVPPTSHRGLAISSGGVTLCLITGGTNISRATNGTTYTYNTAPFTLSNTSVLTRLDAAGLFMLYDYSVSTTTYYTSATGATGSWTSRTLPFVPENNPSSNLTRAAGKVWIKELVDSVANGSIGRLAYTTDGINWTTVTPQYSIQQIAGGYSNLGVNSNKQQAHDAGEPYLMVHVTRYITDTGRTTQLQEQLGRYATTDGITLLAMPWSMSIFDGLPGIMLDATTGVYPSNSGGVWQKYTIDAATKSLPFHESHIIKVL